MGFFDSQLCLFSQNVVVLDYLSPQKCYEYYRTTPIIQQCIQIICHNINLIKEHNGISLQNMNKIVTNLLIFGQVYVVTNKNTILVYGPLSIQQQEDKYIYIRDIVKKTKEYVYISLLYDSISPMSSIQNSIEICNLVKRHYIGLLQNGARPSGILTHANIMSNSKRDLVRKELKDLYKNMEKGSIAVLEGSYQWNSIGICPEKLKLLDNYNYFSKEIAMSFGVPPIVLGLSDPTFSNYKEAKTFLIDNTCKPLLELIESYLKK